MNEALYLLNFTVSGIKNITGELRLDFYKRTVNKFFDPSNYHVKAIYGENGCGKTAVVTAVQILKDLICNRDCLEQREYQDFLSRNINARMQTLHLECEFYHGGEPADQIYHYTIDLYRDEGSYAVSFEELTYRKADYPNSKVFTAYSLEAEQDGAAANGSDDIELRMAALKELGLRLYTNIVDKGLSDNCLSEASEAYLDKLTRFIKVIRPELVKIEIADDTCAELAVVLDYGEYKLQLSQEADGIRRLIKMFPFLEAVEAHGVVFIDDMDRGVNEVVFSRIIAYFAQYGRGQLCFTTHDSTVMADLRRYKNSIDFLCSDGRIIPWRTSGNFSPENLYKNGMIEGIPFNIEPEDFLGLIGD